jgi:hypothetical protein
MEKNDKSKQQEHVSDEQELVSRRAYLLSLKKWSKAVIGGVLLGGLLAHTDKEAEAGWLNRRGGWANGGWVNRRGGGGTWANRTGGWANRVWID